MGTEVALARRVSPHQGNRHLGVALALTREMPHTLAALTEGRISEWAATLLVRETAVLSVEHRVEVDRHLAPHYGTAGQGSGWGERQLAAEARRVGYRLDPGSAIRRVRGATADRRVTARPAPDAMTYLTGFLPVAQGVACYAALTQAADTARAAGDPRTRAQVMADTLVQRLTGQAHATGTPVEIDLVMTDHTLLHGSHEPAVLVRDLTGRVTAWIEVGAPDATRLHYGSKLAERTAVYTYRDPAKVIANWAGKTIHEADAIVLHSFDAGFLDDAAAALARRNTMTVSVTERQLYLELNGTHLSTAVHEQPIRTV